jgi:hypothetical protein
MLPQHLIDGLTVFYGGVGNGMGGTRRKYVTVPYSPSQVQDAVSGFLSHQATLLKMQQMMH